MNSTSLYQMISSLLFELANDVKHSNGLHLHDNAIHAENFLCELLNLVFDWNLENANQTKTNQQVFDLVDVRKKIFVQVTTTQAHQAKYSKVQKDLNKSAYKRYKIFHIFYISRKVNQRYLEQQNVNGIQYEGWDLEKLANAIFYLKKSASKLKPIFQLLKDELVPIDLAHLETPKSIRLPTQTVAVIRKNDFYICRTELTKTLFDFTQTGNGLVTGGPGFGKSFSLLELKRHYNQIGIPCYIIKINELIKASDAELSAELGTQSAWIDALSNVPSSKSKSLLIFDAFDTAKDEQTNQMCSCISKMRLPSLAPTGISRSARAATML
jgi:hypothetical protein